MNRSAWMFAALLAACGGSASTTHDLSLADLSPGDAAHAPAGDAAAIDLGIADLATAYPAGPYGNNVGDTIAPLVWEGYADPLANALAATEPYGTYSMDDLRRSGVPFGVVHVSEFS
jgi:hypothetical protein